MERKRVSGGDGEIETGRERLKQGVRVGGLHNISKDGQTDRKTDRETDKERERVREKETEREREGIQNGDMKHKCQTT